MKGEEEKEGDGDKSLMLLGVEGRKGREESEGGRKGGRNIGEKGGRVGVEGREEKGGR